MILEQGGGKVVNAIDYDAVLKNKWTVLHIVAPLGFVDVAKVFLQNRSDVDAVDQWKKTALHVAAKYGHVDVAKVLIQNGADVNAVTKSNVRQFTRQLRKDMLTLRKC